MKKSLSVLLSAALALGAFASVASAADPANAQEKFDALKAKGIFAGINGEAALDQKMTRAQFARVLGLIKGVNVDAEPTVQTFSDVAKTAWYYQEVEAAVAAKLLVGVGGGKFNPGGDVTVQEIAVALAAALGLEPVKDAKVEGAADWAAGSIQALINNGINLPTTYTSAASREILVNASYEAATKLGVIAPAKVSIASAKQTNAKTVEVKLDKEVDTTKATLTIKRGTASLGGTTKWADDKKSATITLDASIVEDKYTVTLGGIDASTVNVATAEFAGQLEKIAKIEFVTASDVLPMADKVQIEFQAINQFGSQSALSASNFNISSGGVATPVGVSGKQAFTLNLKAVNKDTKLPITIIHPSSGISASKVFTVGEPPIVSKVEIGDLIYVNNKTRVEPNDKVYAKFTAYDQYGIRVNINSDTATGSSMSMPYGLNTSRGVTFVSSDTSIVDKQATPFFDQDGDGNLDLALDVKNPAYMNQDRDITITLYAHGSNQSATKTFKVVLPKQPASVEFGETNLQLADGDTDKYLPLVLKDKEGNTLSADDVINAEKTGKLTIYTTNGSVALADSTPATNDNGTIAVVQRTGDNRGKIRVSTVTGKGFGSVVVMITGTTQQATWNFNIADVRVPTAVKVSTAPAAKMIHADGANITENEVKFKIYDQYGEELNKDFVAAGNTYKVKLELSAIGTATPAATVTGVTYGSELNVSQVFDQSAKITSVANSTDTGTVQVVAKLIKKGATVAQDVEVSSATVRSDVITGLESGLGLTYSVAIDGSKDDTLYAIYKKFVDTNASGAVEFGEGKANSTVDQMAAAIQAKSVSVSAKDAAGNSVALPANRITGVVVGAKSVVDASSGNKLVGIDAGTSAVTVAFKTPNGTDTATKQVTVKGDTIAVDSIAAANANKNISRGTLAGGVNLFADALMGKLTVKDQYGTEYLQGVTDAKTDVLTYNPTLGIAFYVKNIEYTGTGTADTISINASTGVVTYNNAGAKDITKFVIEAVAPNGKKAAITVTLY